MGLLIEQTAIRDFRGLFFLFYCWENCLLVSFQSIGGIRCVRCEVASEKHRKPHHYLGTVLCFS